VTETTDCHTSGCRWIWRWWTCRRSLSTSTSSTWPGRLSGVAAHQSGSS